MPIARLDGGQTTYAHFLANCLLPNEPCLLSPSLVEHWSAFDVWSDGAARLQPDRLPPSFHRLAEHYGAHVVPVVTSAGAGCEEERKETSLAEAVAAMDKAKQSGAGGVYVKDWHLIRQKRRREAVPSKQKEPYEVPSLFADDCG